MLRLKRLLGVVTRILTLDLEILRTNKFTGEDDSFLRYSADSLP
jgi:hypothetical protein